MPVARDVLLDTGPLVAALDANDQWHAATVALWPELVERCITTEAVLTEACHLVQRGRARAALPLEFILAAEIPVLGLETPGLRRALSLMEEYARVPMDYADASLVAVAEGLHLTDVFTTDRRGFRAYRPPRGRRFRVLPEP